MDIYYLLHPVGAPTKEGIKANIERAERWALWLMRSLPDAVIMAPWMLYVKVLDDHRPEDRKRGMRDGFRILRSGIPRAVILTGGRVSTGMGDELEVAGAAGVKRIDLIELGEEPPEQPLFPTHPMMQAK